MTDLLPEFILFHQTLEQHAEDILSGRLKSFGSSMPNEFHHLWQLMNLAFPQAHDLPDPLHTVPILYSRMQLFLTKSHWVNLMRKSGLMGFFMANRMMYEDTMNEAGIPFPKSRVRIVSQS